MQRVNNFPILMVFIKRCLSDSTSKGNKHYTFSVRHIKTELNNCSYLVKKTTAIPRAITCYNPIECGNIIPEKPDLQKFYNKPSLNSEIIFGLGKGTQEGNKVNKYLEGLFNKLISPQHVQEVNNGSDSYSNGLNDRNTNLMNSSIGQVPINCLKGSANLNLIDYLVGENIAIEPLKQQKKRSVFTCEYDTEKGYTKDDPFYHSNLTCFKTEQKYEKNSLVNLNEIDKKNKNDPRIMSNNGFRDQRNTQKNINDQYTSKIKELVSKKIVDLMLFNAKPHEISFNNMLILNPKSQTKPVVVYIKEKGVYVIQSENMNFDCEIKNYIMKLDKCENNGIFTERLNFIRFYKMPYLDCFLDVLPNNDSSFSTLVLSDVPKLLSDKSNPNFSKNIKSAQTSFNNLGKNRQDITLVVQESRPLDSSADKFWILPEDDEVGKNIFKSFANNCEEIQTEEATCIDCDSMSHQKLLASDSELPASDKAPINKDKLIQETVVPNTSILSIVNSIDRSAVIIHKDLYITDQIIQKIQKEEEKSKQKELDKNKLLTGGDRQSHKLYQDIHDYISMKTKTHEEVMPENDLNISHCSLNDGNTKLNNHDDNKIGDQGIFLSLYSIDNNGNMENRADTCDHYVQIKPIECQDRICHKKNQCNELSQYSTSLGYETLKLANPDKPNQRLHKKIENNSATSALNLLFGVDMSSIDKKSKPLKEVFGENLQHNKNNLSSNNALKENIEIDTILEEKSCPKIFQVEANGIQLYKNEDIKLDDDKKAQIYKEKNDVSTVNNNNDLRMEVHGHKFIEKKELAVPVGAIMNFPDYRSIVDNAAECLVTSSTNKNDIAQNIYIPNSRKFGSSTTNSSANKEVDHITKTTISLIKNNNFTDIKVSEVETFVDSRLPVIPFSTETFFQIFGTNSSLRDHSAIIDTTKYKLSLQNKTTGNLKKLDVMAKLDNAERSITKLDIAKSPFLQKIKEPSNESDVPPKKVISSSNNDLRYEKNKTFVNEMKNINLPNLKNITTGGQEKGANGVEKLPLVKDIQNRLPTKTTDFKWIEKNKFDQIDSNIKMVKNHNNKGKGEKGSIVFEQDVKHKEIDQIRTDSVIIKSGESVSGYYIDLFNFYKSHKVSKKSKFPILKKNSIYDQKGFSNQDRKILMEISKHRPNRKRINKQPVRSTTNRKPGKKVFKRPGKGRFMGILNGSKNKQAVNDTIRLPIKTIIKSNKKNQSDVEMSNLSGTHLDKSKQLLSNAKQNDQVAKEEQKFPENTYNTPQKIANNKYLVPKYVASNLNQNKNYPVKFDKQQHKLPQRGASKTNKHAHLPKKKEVKKIDSVKSILKNKDSGTKLVEVEKLISPKPGGSIQNSELKQTVLESTEKQSNISKDDDEKPDDESCKKPLCYTYIATEAYINNAEKIKSIPDKTFSFPSFSKLIEKSPPPPPQKVTILEKYNKTTINEDKEIQETFRKDLIKKSQEKIELKSGIDFRLKTPKIKTMKSKLKLLKRNKQKKESSSVSMDGKVPLFTKKVKKNSKPCTPKTYMSNDSKIKNSELKESQKPSAKINLKSKQELSSVKYSAKKETSKNLVRRNPNNKASLKSFNDMPLAVNLPEKESSKKYNFKHEFPSGALKDMSSTKTLLKKEPSKKRRLKNSPSSKALEKMSNSKVTLEPVIKTEENATKGVDKSHLNKGESRRSRNEKNKYIAAAIVPVTATKKPVNVAQVPVIVSQDQILVSHEPVTVTKKPVTARQQPTPLQTKIANRKDFPMLLIDVDKMSKEIKPELDLNKCQKCSIVQDKIIDFPLHNTKKRLLFPRASQVLNLDPSRDPVLRKELDSFPSVTKILNATIPENSREMLREWRRSMIDELGEDGFKLFYKGQLVNGSKFHSQLHTSLLGHPSLEESLHSSMKSIQNVLRRLTDITAVNSHVVHRKLSYRGVIDCVAKYQNKPVLIEWKRLENPQVKVVDSSLDVASVQLSAYAGAVNFDDAYKFQLSGGLIVVAYNDGSEAEVIEINKDRCAVHWKEWLKRLQQFQKLLHKKQN